MGASDLPQLKKVSRLLKIDRQFDDRRADLKSRILIFWRPKPTSGVI
jgi:hypothetical protein